MRVLRIGADLGGRRVLKARCRREALGAELGDKRREREVVDASCRGAPLDSDAECGRARGWARVMAARHRRFVR